MIDHYASGVLKKEHHERLVADMANYAHDAGIQQHWISSPLTEQVSPEEIAYIKAFNKHLVSGDHAGMAYTQDSHAAENPNQYFSMLAGCLVRNFVRARVMTLGTVLDAIHRRDMPELSAILIPNFFITQAEGGHIAAWQVNALYDMLMARQVAGQQTIIYVSKIDQMGKEYGTALRDLVNANYTLIGG